MQLKDSNDLSSVYKLFGVCAHHCSNIEYNIALLLHPSTWSKHWKDLERKKTELNNKHFNIREWNAAMKRFDEALNNVQQDIGCLDKLPLGALIKEVKTGYQLSSEQTKYLKDILDKRNYVIHKIWGVYGRRLQDPLVVREMLAELTGYEVFFRYASGWTREQAHRMNGINS